MALDSPKPAGTKCISPYLVVEKSSEWEVPCTFWENVQLSLQLSKDILTGPVQVVVKG